MNTSAKDHAKTADQVTHALLTQTDTLIASLALGLIAMAGGVLMVVGLAFLLVS